MQEETSQFEDIEVNVYPMIKTLGQEEMRDEFTMQIPECCREGWDDCPHVVNRDFTRIKRNIGL